MSLKRSLFLSIVLLLTFVLTACLDKQKIGLDAVEIVIEDHYVEMKDGVKLATRVYRPDDDHQYPVLLGRTTYGSGAFSSAEEGDYRELGMKMSEKGYVVVVQDVRGLYQSEGVWTLFKDDAADGYETVLWLNDQPWSNGRVGAFGASALGMTANLLATANPPGLKAAFVQMAPSQFYEEVIAEGGIYRHEVFTSWLSLINSVMAQKMLHEREINQETYNKMVDFNLGFRNLYLHTPLRNMPNLEKNTEFNAVFEHYMKDGYYNYYDIYSKLSSIQIPIYHVGGWYDTFLEGTLKNFVGLQENGGNGAKGNQKLLMGPWTHRDFVPNGIDGDNSFFAGDEISLLDEMERWFDYWLKDIDTGVMDEDSMRYYSIGTSEWKTTNVWPLKNTKEEKWYFNGEKSYSALSINDGVLSSELPLSEGKNQYIYDPMNPNFTIGGRNLFSEGVGLGPLDQRMIEARSLTYTSEPLTEPLEIGGTITATLFVSSDAKDTDFTVNLSDVVPDGTSYLLREGALRMRFREGLDKELFMEDGKVYEITINLGDISHVFGEGHRIRVSVASSNFPRYDRNSNTGNPLGVDSEEDFVVAENTVYIGPNHLSHISLPVVIK